MNLLSIYYDLLSKKDPNLQFTLIQCNGSVNQQKDIHVGLHLVIKHIVHTKNQIIISQGFRCRVFTECYTETYVYPLALYQITNARVLFSDPGMSIHNVNRFAQTNEQIIQLILGAFTAINRIADGYITITDESVNRITSPTVPTLPLLGTVAPYVNQPTNISVLSDIVNRNLFNLVTVFKCSIDTENSKNIAITTGYLSWFNSNRPSLKSLGYIASYPHIHTFNIYHSTDGKSSFRSLLSINQHDHESMDDNIDTSKSTYLYYILDKLLAHYDDTLKIVRSLPNKTDQNAAIEHIKMLISKSNTAIENLNNYPNLFACYRRFYPPKPSLSTSTDAKPFVPSWLVKNENFSSVIDKLYSLFTDGWTNDN